MEHLIFVIGTVLFLCIILRNLNRNNEPFD